MIVTRRLSAIVCGLLLAILSWNQVQAAQERETPQQRVADLKAWLQASREQMKAYEWIETTTVSVDGEQKSMTQQRCYYGEEGKLVKVMLEQTQPEQGGQGIFGIMGAIKEHKKEELLDYINNARNLVQDYIPLTAERVQQATSNGYMSLQVLEPGRKVELKFDNYLKEGDSISATIALPTNQLLGVSIATYLADDTQNTVTMNATTGVLPDGTIYVQKILLDGSSRNVTVSVQNAGYQRLPR
ncbi:MAG: hypothetical protein KDI17_17875 [Halioglobus sp.]|nr:hypothetical protein [Halioglobus sp.]